MENLWQPNPLQAINICNKIWWTIRYSA